MRKPLTDESGEVRELTLADFRAMRNASQVLPAELVKVMPLQHSKKTQPNKKVQVTIKLDQDVVDRFRAAGPGWESRINDALKKVAV